MNEDEKRNKTIMNARTSLNGRRPDNNNNYPPGLRQIWREGRPRAYRGVFSHHLVEYMHEGFRAMLAVSPVISYAYMWP